LYTACTQYQQQLYFSTGFMYIWTNYQINTAISHKFNWKLTFHILAT